MASNSPGSFVVPGDGRDVGLTVDSLFLFTLSLSGGAFGATLNAGGEGATPLIPTNFSQPFTFHAAAAAYDLSTGLVYGELSDVRPVAVQ